MITQEFKKKVSDAVLSQLQNYAGTPAEFARQIGIRRELLDEMRKGKISNSISDQVWITLARTFGVGLTQERDWITAKTDVFVYITTQLELCQKLSGSGIFCDKAGIGKSYAAKYYAENHKNVAYIDCSLVKSKHLFVREIARQFHVTHIGPLERVQSDLIFYLKSIEKPLIIVDEAGDLVMNAFLELKALWNATEKQCGWFMMGADGLRNKINKGMTPEKEKIGFAELFDRYGCKYQRVTPENEQDNRRYMMRQAALIIKANNPEADIQQVIAKTDCSLRKIETEISKQAGA